MSDDVNQKAAPRPQARTRLARRAVIDAARTLFLAHGYASTTIAAISRQADVPEPTIYRLFSSKVGILKVLIDVSIAGDDDPVSIPERPAVVALLDQPDARNALAGFAAVTTKINQRTNGLYAILTRAADAEPEAATLLDGLRHQRDHGQARIVNALHRTHRLRPGLTARTATDIVQALMSPEVYRLLVTDRGWTPTRYQAWATDLLASQLL